ncbi:hypothetical protein [Streptomyces sp. NPDC088925]|uniref:hypothetical protein n=2 Tax=unclassified Streptomyces TaxID=2593676 RepID=UPI00380536E0
MSAALIGLNVCVAAITLLGLGYFARVRMPRPPVGKYEPPDVLVVMAVVMLAPLLYLELPRTAVAVVFGLVLCAALQFTLAPLLGGLGAALLAVLAVAVTGGLALADRTLAVLVLTDVLLAVAVVGVATMWAQSGFKSVHTAWFAGLLAVYDLLATGLSSVMDRFAAQVMGLPFAPLLAVTRGDPPVALGLGDLLLIVLFPLVAAKAYGRAAALLAGALGVLASSAISVLFATGTLTGAFPLMVVLGPVIVAQHLYWVRRTGRERTTAEWRAGALATVPVTAASPVLLAALGTPGAPGDLHERARPGDWVALLDGEVVGTGPSAGSARKDAARRGTGAVPLVRQV